jgi:YidC/Oxa1 family membrane protein insertase
MKEMQKLQPKMLELREKYKNDKQRLSQETMALYKAYKVNPMGGCLPMIIQIPSFSAFTRPFFTPSNCATLLFLVDSGSVRKRPLLHHAVNHGGHDVHSTENDACLRDPTQAKIMLWMPVIFTFLFLNFPSGLVIYWLFNNILSIGQQHYINKRA